MTSPQTEWPSTPVAEPIKQLIANFFIIGDQKDEAAAHRLGEEIFAPTGQIIVNKRVISGAAEIASSNHGLLQGLKSRRHSVHKIYACSEATDDLMLFGVVTWRFDDGSSRDGPFAARAVVEDGASDTPKLKLYQGWADLSELMAALQQQQR